MSSDLSPWRWHQINQLIETDFPIMMCMSDFITRAKGEFERKQLPWKEEVVGVRYDAWKQLAAEIYVSQESDWILKSSIIYWRNARLVPFLLTEQIFKARPELSVCYIAMPNGELLCL